MATWLPPDPFERSVRFGSILIGVLLILWAADELGFIDIWS